MALVQKWLCTKRARIIKNEYKLVFGNYTNYRDEDGVHAKYEKWNKEYYICLIKW